MNRAVAVNRMQLGIGALKLRSCSTAGMAARASAPSQGFGTQLVSLATSRAPNSHKKWAATSTNLQFAQSFACSAPRRLPHESQRLAPHGTHFGMLVCPGLKRWDFSPVIFQQLHARPLALPSLHAVLTRKIQSNPSPVPIFTATTRGNQATPSRQLSTLQSTELDKDGAPPQDWWTTNLLGVIICANVAVFLLWQVTKIRRFMAKNFAISTHGVTKEWRLHTVLSSIFSHYDPAHLATNMLTLWVFGAEALLLLGARRFLHLYMWGGLLSSVCQVAWPAVARHLSLPSKYVVSPYQLGLGASGAINAVVAYSILNYPHRILLLFFVLPVPASLFGATFLAKDLVGLYYGDSSYGNAAHIGGSLFGFLFWLRFRAGPSVLPM